MASKRRNMFYQNKEQETQHNVQRMPVNFESHFPAALILMEGRLSKGRGGGVGPVFLYKGRPVTKPTGTPLASTVHLKYGALLHYHTPGSASRQISTTTVATDKVIDGPFIVFLGFRRPVTLAAELSEEECRVPPPNWPKSPPSCCKGNPPIPTEEMQKAFEKCIDTLPKPPEELAPGQQDPRLCVEECVYKEVGFINAGKSIVKNVVSEKLGKSAPAPWTAIMKAAVDTCNNAKSQRAASGQCSELPHDHTHCLARQLFLALSHDCRAWDRTGFIWEDNGVGKPDAHAPLATTP
ncbi:hypothetical protein AAG570_011328 [Ranatra chinensis]|uniref:Uncharacterized protein n=1 Tax=Ranatra chinensis TaxID=642074 RepID=A0ABD0YKD0_9HEMI